VDVETGGMPVRGSGGSLDRAVVCVSNDGPRYQVLRALEDSRYEVLADVDRGLELLPPVAEFAPDVVVLDLALVGTLGLRLFTMIKTLAPEVAIVVLAPLQTFHVAAIEAGAHAVVPGDDLRQLREVLGKLADSPVA
jgi:DNA-binding NarL/FixJ family response regulator